MTFENEIDYEFKKFDIALDEKQINQFKRFYELLIEWNNKMNLTTITDMKEVIIKHFIDSISIVKLINLNEKKDIKLADIGTGAGFPGIPIKILFPKLDITLLDSLNKRVVFMENVLKELELTGIRAIHARAEEAGRSNEYRESFEICVSRAVARLNSLCELCLPFVKKSGYFVAYKAQKAEEEIEEAGRAIKLLGGTISNTKHLVINSEARVLIQIRKIEATPKKYPRAGGKPINQPL